MVRALQPWHVNIRKRQVKSPKVYFRDMGLLHALLNLPTHAELQGHPKLGASWEGFALEQTLRICRADAAECFFWATHADAELDLLIARGDKKMAFEFKYASTPRVTPFHARRFAGPGTRPNQHRLPWATMPTRLRRMSG